MVAARIWERAALLEVRPISVEIGSGQVWSVIVKLYLCLANIPRAAPNGSIWENRRAIEEHDWSAARTPCHARGN